MPPLIPPDPPGLPVVITRAEALTAGFTDARIRSQIASGRWAVIGTGSYVRLCAAALDTDPFEADRMLHSHQVAAAARRRTDAVIGVGSAAILHGLPLVTGVPDRLQLLVPRGSWVGVRSGVQTRLARIDSADLEVVTPDDGGPVVVTTIARTWVDVARSHCLADALSVGDAALRAGLMTKRDVEELMERMGRFRGRDAAERALALIDPLRESPLESGSAARFIEWDFPAPRLQHTFHDEHGPIARADFDWDRPQIIGFADGLNKYVRDPARDRQERIQEARLRPHGTVARWGWSDMAGTGIGLWRLMAPLLKVERPFPRTDERW